MKTYLKGGLEEGSVRTLGKKGFWTIPSKGIKFREGVWRRWFLTRARSRGGGY